MGRSTPFPQTPLSRAQILERVNTIPQRPNMESGKRAYEADVNAWHQMHDNAPPGLERPYPVKLGMAQAGSGECFGCGAITDPPHMGYTCNATEPLRPQETRWRQLVANMLRRAMSIRTPPAPVQYVWPVPPPHPNYHQTTPFPIYMVAPTGEWPLNEPNIEHTESFNAYWDPHGAENYTGLLSNADHQ
ncbi:hypothetical protein PAXRUDRAFT_163620 [Paxillus rubicundulus Ve08.2h10]|uniref:Uncharacterized protein n=1 Tax=Paxillus rubicundulus Ve08.2h10 TaxID=930991 RepID=A0A0D0C624_9AGAM|nr:hypothetical protein PAXRUDRAFT_163620 [Paxillus rubicundulus Ve08.2h10]